VSIIGHVLIPETMNAEDVDPYSALELCSGNATYDEADDVENEGGRIYSLYFTADPSKGGGEYCLHTRNWEEMVRLVMRLPFRPKDWPK
jgi:hypothetical protein